MSSQEELSGIVEQLTKIEQLAEEPAFTASLEAIEEAIAKVAKAWSGSNLGYHANIYYAGLQHPPPGAHFSLEWGAQEVFGDYGTSGDWREWDPDTVTTSIRSMAGNPDLSSAERLAAKARNIYETLQSEVVSVLSSELADTEDSLLEKLRSEVESIGILSYGQIVNRLVPSRQVMTRDATALGQGFRTPPHIALRASILALREPINACSTLGVLAKKAASHIARTHRKKGANSKPMNGPIANADIWALIHPTIHPIAKPRFDAGFFSDAVEASLKEVNDVVKRIVRESTGKELDGAGLMTTAFSPQSPLIRLTELNTESDKNVQQGYMQIMAGTMTGIRNPKAHANIPLTNAEAMHLIVLASLLMHKVENRSQSPSDNQTAA